MPPKLILFVLLLVIGQLTHAQTAKPFVYEEAFSGDSNYRLDDTYSFRTVNMGQLTVRSGRLVVSDLIALHYCPPLPVHFPAGSFPVQLSIGRTKDAPRPYAAYYRVVFANTPVIRWERTVTDLKHRGLFDEGYDSGLLNPTYGLALIIDSAAAARLNNSSHRTWAHVLLDQPPAYGSGDIRPVGPYRFCELWVNAGTIITTHVGYDASSHINRLLVDLGELQLAPSYYR